MLALIVTLSAVGAVPLKVEVSVAGAPTSRVSAVVTATPGFEGGRAQSQAITPGTPVTFLVTPGSWSVSCAARGFWGETRGVVVTPGGASPVLCRLWPLAAVEGVLRVPEGKTATRLSWRTVIVPGQGVSEEDFSGECRVHEGGRFACELPAGVRHLALKAPGFAAHYLWGAELVPGKPLAVGELKLRPGGSVVGWVVGPAPLLAEGKAEVVATPRVMEPVSTPLAQAQQQVANVDRRGFFQFSGLAPGSWSFSARASQGARSLPVVAVVAEGLETELKNPLELQLPSVLQVSVTPPQAPGGGLWRVEVWDQDAVRATFQMVARSVADGGGVCRIDGLLPGSYWVQVRDDQGKTHFKDRVEVRGEWATLEVRLSYPRVVGRVSLGDKPVRAKVVFGGEFAAARVEAHSDAEGHYACVLPQGGRFLVEVTVEGSQLRRRFTDVEVPEKKGGEEVRLDFTLPDTAVSGSLVSEDGKPLFGVVNARGTRGEGQYANLRTAEDGRFLLRGLDPGTVWLQGQAPGYAGDWVPVQLAEGESREVELRLARRREVRGRLSFGGVGVPGGRISAFLEPKPTPDATFEAFSESDGAGQFTLSLRSGRRYRLVVEAPGFMREVLSWEVGDADEPVDVPLRQGGGTLILALPWPQVQGFFVVYEGFPETAWAYEDWAARHGSAPARGALEVPQLPAGSYRVCRMAAGGPACVEGYLAEGGTLRLELASGKGQPQP